MRVGLSSVVLLGLALPLVGCAAEEAVESDPSMVFAGPLPSNDDSSPPSTSAPAKTQPGKTSSAATRPASPPAVDPATVSHPEVVYVLMAGRDGWTWFCTGALISKDVVVTAAHCLQSKLFASWEIVAPTLPNQPRVEGAATAMYDDGWSEVAKPDIGIIKLATPIELPAYAQLTDVSAAVDGGQTRSVSTIVRSAQQPEAPLKKTGELKLSSTKQFGYESGYGVPSFSQGGDSGAGMFLVENGQMTHKLVAVEREPDPARKLDHLTRVDAAFISWVAAQ